MTPLDILEQYWGYSQFRPCQAEIIDSVLNGHDTIGLLPTGGGKSITFQVPAMLLPGVTLVITPLISLMKDQVDNLRAIGIRAACLHSGMSRSEQNLALDKARLDKIKLLYLSPERASRESFRQEMSRWNVSLIVVDEAHCISQWGYDFRPNYLKLAELRPLAPDAPILALTASATPEVLADIRDKLELKSPETFSRSFSRENISYLVRRSEDKQSMMLRIIGSTTGTTIVYVRSRRRCQELAEILNKAGFTADYYHAGLSNEEKDQRQNNWKNNMVRIMVATNAFGMGIDKPDVRLVIHHDIPPSLEEYYQEAGRAGRDGKPSYAVMLVSKADSATLSRRLNESFPPKDEIVRVYDRLGVWLNVGIDEGFNQVFDCNFDRFCQSNGFQPARTRSALGILTLAGYIEYVDDMASLAKVMILINKSEFYSLDLTPETDSVFQTILRTYTGLFSDYTSINEEEIARLTGRSVQTVYESLLALNRMHVLSYIPRRLEPYVYYRQRRQLPKYIEIPLAVYEHRLKRARERVESVRKYAYDDTGCRVQRMLKYFGEENAVPCGKCDYCRSLKKPVNTITCEEVLADFDRILEALGSETVTIKSFVDRYPPSRQAEVIECIRQLVDRGKLKWPDHMTLARK